MRDKLSETHMDFSRPYRLGANRLPRRQGKQFFKRIRCPNRFRLDTSLYIVDSEVSHRNETVLIILRVLHPEAWTGKMPMALGQQKRFWNLIEPLAPLATRILPALLP